MDHTFLSALILLLLLLVLDPLGSLPIFISVMRAVPKERRTLVAVREIGLAFAVLLGLLGVAILMGWDKRLEALFVQWMPDAWVNLTVGI